MTITARPVTYCDVASHARFSVARYQRMIETGILTPEDKVELLENYVVLKMPRNPPHDGTIQLLNKRLSRRIPAGWDLRVQSTIVLPDSQPEPDGAVAGGDETTYLSRHPTPADLGLVVEVANTSLLRDQRDKTRIYARSQITCYWIVNLVDRQIEVYTQPSGPAEMPSYGSCHIYKPGDAVPLVLGGIEVARVPANELIL